MLGKRSSAYGGPERRRNRVYRTRNSEYYCRDDVCVAVRDRATGKIHGDHRAVGLRMTGGICFSADGGVQSFSKHGEQPHRGESIFFSNGSLQQTVRTSALEEVARPPHPQG